LFTNNKYNVSLNLNDSECFFSKNDKIREFHKLTYFNKCYINNNSTYDTNLNSINSKQTNSKDYSSFNNVNMKQYMCNGDNECKEINDNEISVNLINKRKDITIVLPYVENLGIESFNKTLNNIQNLNYIIISNISIPNKNVYIYNFNNIWQAFNYGLKRVKTKYVHFILPGDYLYENSYDFESEADVIQLQHIRTDGIKYWMKNNNEIGIYNVYKSIPNHLNMICDKIFKTNLVIKNAFHDNLKAPLIFTLEILAKAKTMEVINNKIIHTVRKEKKTTETEKSLMLTGMNIFLSNIETENIILNNLIEGIIEKNNLNKWNNCIDYVFPYVTMSDPYWQEQYKKYYSGDGSDWKAGIERYRDNGILKYIFRSIEKHLPFIRDVYMIVMSESQIPSWVNKNKVKFIFHKDFIPSKFLPTFNSMTIETFLPLTSLTDMIIYSNDDILTFKDLSKDFFFRGGIPVYSMNFRNYNGAAKGDRVRNNVYNLILGKKQNKKVVTTQHGPIPYRMDWIKEFYKVYGNETSSHTTMFREDENYNQYVFAFYQMMEKRIFNSEKDIVNYDMKEQLYERIINDDFESHDFVCINDNAFSTEEQWNNVLNKIDKLLPNKSKYEKYEN